MAKLSDLTRVVAAATGESHPGLVVLARALRQSDLVATGGRGNNAARMNHLDAANFLLGVASPGDNTTANRTVATVGALRLWRGGFAHLRDGTQTVTILDGSAAVAGLKGGQSLSTSLSQLLQSYDQEAGFDPIIKDPRFFKKMPSFEVERKMDSPGELFQADMRPAAVSLSVSKRLFAVEANREPTWSASMEVMCSGGDLIRLKFSPEGGISSSRLPFFSSSKTITERVEPSVIDAVVACIRAAESSPKREELNS